jgi:4-hydroxy-tetrahydrodipicolinate synthase
MEQWQRLMEAAFDAVKGRKPLLGGVMDTSSRRIRDKTRILRDIGYEYFVIAPSFFIPSRTGTEHVRLFGAAREAAGEMEMVAYNNPQTIGAALAVDTVCELARRGWIRCCKESSGDMEHFRELVKRGKEAGLSVLAGDEFYFMDALRAGARGLVPGCACIFPEVFRMAWEAAVRGDWDTVAAAFSRILRIRSALVTGGACWLSGIKYAASVLGIGSGKPMAPLEPAGTRQKEQIEELIRIEAGA